MSATNTPVQVTLRVPGAWSHPGELVERMPAGFRLTPESLLLPDGGTVEFTPMPPDDQFAQIFTSSCRQLPAEDELDIVSRYRVNIGLTGPGGSLESARVMMQAGAAIVQAGGAGVFIDNSGLAHGGGHWMEMADDGGPDALSFAFVSIVSGEHDVWTMGMHVLGYPEIIMRRADLDADANAIIEVVRYVCAGEKPVGDGHILCDENGPRFQATAAPADERTADSPMHNPFGRLRLTSVKEIVEGN
jgi:hypothetical protein